MRPLIFIILLAVAFCRTPDRFQIDLTAPPSTRYTQIAAAKSDSILRFLAHLHTVPKYRAAFAFSESLSPITLKSLVGSQFYEECKSIARAIKKPVSEIVVFNYMYELGAYNNFCTSITVQAGGQYYLARNLDYGYQEFLSNNSVILTFMQNGKPLFETVGHAGLIGAHTGLRFGAYSITLNERIEGGLHLTLEQILLKRSETTPYLIKKALIHKSTVEEAVHYLSATTTASPAYFILNSAGQNILIEKKRVGTQAIFTTSDYLVQTNTDLELPDPDTRRTVAQNKMKALKESGTNITKDAVWQILCEPPNKNNLTLITILLDTGKGQVRAEVWA